MPELPEAETIARTLHAALAGERIERVRLRRRDFLKTGTPAQLARLRGAALERVFRRGKCVVFDVDRRYLVLQLGMSGRVCLDWPADPLLPHTHLVILFADGLQLRYANTRRIASGVHLLASADEGPLGRLGPDADRIALGEFRRRLAGRRAPIKACLLNQALLAGVGNIYADESLFRAGILPTRRADRVAPADLARLHRAVRRVLTEAIRAGGSTLDDATPFVGARGEMGYFTHAHRVYGRYGLPCRRCGYTLQRTLVAGRTSTFCPHCQR